MQNHPFSTPLAFETQLRPELAKREALARNYRADVRLAALAATRPTPAQHAAARAAWFTGTQA